MSSLIPTLQDVIDSDMCIACGACVEACPENAIIPTYNDYRGSQEVEILDTSQCDSCDQVCEKVCPSVSVDYRDYEGAQGSERLGKIEGVYTGYSKQFQFNGVSSSGGVMREIIHYYVEREIPVICLAGINGEYQAEAIDSLKKMKIIPGSIYHGVQFFDAISLVRSIEGKCVIVAIPCVLEGIQKYIAECEPELGKKIELTAGIICGWMYSDHSWKAFAKFKHIQDKVVDIAYRGEDKVGDLKLKTSSSVHNYPRRNFPDFKDELDFKTSYSGVFNRLRCQVCQNHTNISADISVGDAWLERLPASEDKVSVVIARTERGHQLIETMHETGLLVMANSSADDIIESQSYNLVHGISAQELVMYQVARGSAVPQFKYTGTHVETIGRRRYISLFEHFIWRKLVRLEYYSLYRLRIMLRYLPRQLKRFLKSLLLTNKA
jgi:coenzyme F420-reducing hydrogenase beta subunit